MNIQNQNKSIGNIAAEYFSKGYYCSEAVSLAFEDCTKYSLSPDFKKSMTMLGEGIGNSGCICGALSAAVLIAGIFSGRIDNKEDKKYPQNIGKYFINEFKAKYTTTCCKTLKKRSEILFGLGQYRHCAEMTSFCAELLLKTANKENWISGENNE